ncbi:hypothetical protein [Cedecea davisae]|uniref:hypothetical protein n=1 Tax=Cedecea davisae TaxID=158484 RepID=UPI003119F54E
MGLLGVQVAIALVVTLPLWLHEISTGAVPHWNTMTVSAVVYLGVFPSFVSYLLYGRCVETVGAARAGLSIPPDPGVWRSAVADFPRRDAASFPYHRHCDYFGWSGAGQQTLAFIQADPAPKGAGRISQDVSTRTAETTKA